MRSSASAPWGAAKQRISPGSRYQPMNITYTSQPELPLSCCLCLCPVLIGCRTEPCFHFVCLDCAQSLQSSSCPVCQQPVTSLGPVHPDKTLKLCQQGNDSRVFQNELGLLIHRLHTHSSNA